MTFTLKRRWTFPLCIIFSFGFLEICHAQQGDTLPGITIDSLKTPGFIKMVKKLAADQTSEKQRIYKEGKISMAQRRTTDEIKAVSQNVKLFMKDGLDTVAIERELQETGRLLEIAKDGVFVNPGTTQSQRNLAVTATIVTELQENIASQKLLLDRYTRNLTIYKDKLDSLSSDSSLYFFPEDSLGIVKYTKRLVVVNKEIKPIDSSLQFAMANAQELQLKLDLMAYDLHSISDDIERTRYLLSSKVFDRELANIWGPVGFRRPLREIVSFSTYKEFMVLEFYLLENRGRLFVILLLIAAASFFAGSVKKLVHLDTVLKNESAQLVLKYPRLSSVFVVLNIFQFIFINPPFIFNFCVSSVSIMCLTIIFRHAIDRYWLRFWYVAIVFFLLATADNFLLQASRTERWFMLLLAAAGPLLIIYIFASGHRKDLRERGLTYFMIFVGVIETASFFLNMFGRFNISKSFLITGYVGIVVAILFFWTVRLINEMLGLTYKVYKFPDKKLFYINFDRVGTEVPGIFYWLLVFGWFVIMGKNFYAFKQLAEPVERFLVRTRTVGEFTFSLGGILIFVSILVASLLLSRIISFFASAPPSPHGTTKGDRIGIGSWLLLIRIFILTLGLLLAFAATGIPVDRLTIIIGALGVGVGLGLQSLVTNLVSGLIIAFEKPVNVGDLLEVNGKMATMKSIGFRSSIAKLSDGSHVVIPNGDVLNQHLVNWSMGKNMKKTAVSIGVAYGTSIDAASQLFTNILKTTDHVMSSPAPTVFAKEFGGYAIQFELSFWVAHLSEADPVRNNILSKIADECRKSGIVIPVPRQDVYLVPDADKNP